MIAHRIVEMEGGCRDTSHMDAPAAQRTEMPDVKAFSGSSFVEMAVNFEFVEKVAQRFESTNVAVHPILDSAITPGVCLVRLASTDPDDLSGAADVVFLYPETHCSY